MTHPGAFTHNCEICGRWGSFGQGVKLRHGQEGVWFCFAHLPLDFKRHWASSEASTEPPGVTTPAAQSEGAAGVSPGQGLDAARLQGVESTTAPIEPIRHSPAERRGAPRSSSPAGQDDLFSTMGKST